MEPVALPEILALPVMPGPPEILPVAEEVAEETIFLGQHQQAEPAGLVEPVIQLLHLRLLLEPAVQPVPRQQQVVLAELHPHSWAM